MPNTDNNEGIWIGLDFGTSNSACAVWDSSRGSPKWIRLKDIAPQQENGKIGRLVPSLVRLQGNDQHLVGAEALKQLTGTSISSIKRLLGKRMSEIDPQWLESLPFEVQEDENENLQLVITGQNNQKVITTPVEIIADILKATREVAQWYLDKYSRKKHLEVPGSKLIRHVVVGVPAHFSKRHIALLKEACQKAGFDGIISTCLESTAAAMAYGLTLQESSSKANIMVIDMGGGTTDITIATKTEKKDEEQHASYRVLVTKGDAHLGGDDIDLQLLEYCLSQSSCTGMAQSDLRKSCCKAKEALSRHESPSQSESVVADKKQVILTQQLFEQLILPWLERARSLIRETLDQYHNTTMLPPHSSAIPEISEVILVGGTTRIPAIQRMIQSFFPELELCTSLNPMSSVAQGLAIQAAINSKLIPLHQLQSALMLDCIPHPIGVELADGQFIEVLSRNASLPAMGSAVFILADKYQKGVTIRAVEKVGEGQYEPMAKSDFSFLLRRLPLKEYEEMSQRSIEVGMKCDTEGRFIVSIFDEKDPEQVRKKERFEKTDQDQVGELGYIANLVLSESGTSVEQYLLLGTLIGVVVLYIAVRLAFNDPEIEPLP